MGGIRASLPGTSVGAAHAARVEILAPATRRRYCKTQVDAKVEIVDIATSAEVLAAVVARLVQTQLRQRAVAGLAGVPRVQVQVQVPEHGVGILWVNGQVERLLNAESYRFWKLNGTVSVELVDLRLQSLDVTARETLTHDKVALRLNLSPTWRLTDVLMARKELARPADDLYRGLQFGRRAAVGTRLLDELLENKTAIDEVVTAQVKSKLAGRGLQLDGVGVKDIVRPGEMKTILAQVVEVGKSAEANVFRRREEPAATRSPLNTAKVMEDSPVALRLKELETVERLAERIDKISVFGGLEQVLNGLVRLR